MKRPLSSFLGTATLFGVCAALSLFLSEWILGSFYAAINYRTFLFYLALYLPAGAVGGAVLGLFLKLFSSVLSSRWIGVNRPSFLPAAVMFSFFYIYGFYYINEKLTARVGALAPLSLAADLAFLLLSFLVFRLVVALPERKGSAVLGFLEVGFLPLILLVGVNLRFFIWQPPHTQIPELVFGTIAFGLAGLAGAALVWLHAKILTASASTGARFASVAVMAAIVFAILVWSGTPSTASFDRTDDEFLAQEAVQKPKNIIWIVTDTARRDHVSVYGGQRQTTPSLEQFAQDALVFDNAISAAPWTLPSHASMFTGMFPSKHGAHFVGDAMFSTPLVPGNLTIGEILSAHGYNTAGIAANNAGLSRQLGCHQGFQYYFDGRPLVFSMFWGKVLLQLSDDFRIDELWVNEVCLATEMEPIVNNWLDDNADDGPFFLFVNLMEPHGGIAFVPEPYDSLYGFDRQRQQEVFKDFDADKVVFYQAEVTDEHRAFWNGYVQRKITFMDAYLGRLFARLKEKGLYDDSMVIVNSDHGELFGEHNSFGHNTDLYNELIRVPLMVKYPQAAKTGRDAKLVQTVDLMPEILAQLGIEIPANVQGQPIDQANHPVIAELFQQQHNAHAKRSPGRYYRDLRAIFGNVAGDSLKYIWASNDKAELFDMANDPDELTDVLQQRPLAADSLRARLGRWASSFKPMETKGQTRNIDKKELEKRLRSLGYIK